ncbi:hypothetical protein DL767_011404 [Monosporascus sp. MG133]|nr:hypothetical protein DL767_011404 [Monosporascus sp. MG133]
MWYTVGAFPAASDIDGILAFSHSSTTHNGNGASAGLVNMVKKIMILAGAPEHRTLDWEDGRLLDTFLSAFATFATQPESPPTAPIGTDPGSSSDNAVWRSIPLHKARLETGLSQVHGLEYAHYGDPEFFETASFSTTASTEMPATDPASQSILNQFYDHSLAIHDDIPSSQLPSGSFSTVVSSFNTTDDISRDGSVEASSFAPGHHLHAPDIAHLSDLDDIPSAAYLQSISPQTMTVNLIVGVISIAEPRTVKTRWGSTKSLVELLVGDETKSGFTITFWLTSDSESNAHDSGSAESTLRCLRRQDIVLLRNVALGAFMNKVHGHSLRKGLTKVDLLYRRRLDGDDVSGLYSTKQLSSKRPGHPQLKKTKRVWEWVMNFVGRGATSLGKQKLRSRTPHVDDQQFLALDAFIALVLFSRHHSAISPAIPAPRSEPATHACQKSPLGGDVIVVLRTGATEALEKLPVHSETILTCVSDYVIYSDMEEDIEGNHVYDVLDQVNDTIKYTVPEFKLYNHLRASGRRGLNYQTMFGSGPSGALENPGWKLDKWKFLPMADWALQHRPNVKWFVFIESDTYMIWHNMLEYLSRFNASRPHYLGKHMYIGDVIFAHGKSGFALSNPAPRTVTGYWREHRDQFDQYTEREWASDMILGKALKDVGVDMR